MADSPALRPKGVPQFPLLDMGDDDFEEMNARLIRLEWEEARKPADKKDGGVDMLLPRAGGGYEKAWQSKHFVNRIHWTQCEKSLKDATENYAPERYTFVFPRNLTKNEQKTFDAHFRKDGMTVKVDYWNATEIESRLAGSDDGMRVARTFFESVEIDRELTYRAIEAAGRIETVHDVLDRATNLGHVVTAKDAFFDYPLAIHPTDSDGPGRTPGSVMSYSTSDGAITSRTDVVPLDDDAMERYGPQFELRPTADQKGRAAQALLEKALSEGVSADISEGMDLVFTQLPPGLKDMVGRPLTGGRIKLGASPKPRYPIEPWDARVRVVTDRGEEVIVLRLQQLEAVPDGWDDGVSGIFGGLTVAMRMRWRDGQGGEVNWNFSYQRDDTTARDQLEAVRFLLAASVEGTITITDLTPGSERPEQILQRPAATLPPEMPALLAFLEDVVTIEDWAGGRFQLPDSVTGDEARKVATVAQYIRRGGGNVLWHELSFTVPADAVAHYAGPGKTFRFEQGIAANVLGRAVPLGYARLDIPGYVLETSPGASDDEVELHLRAPEPDGMPLFEQLVKDPTDAAPAAAELGGS